MPAGKLSPLSYLILGLLRDGTASHGYRLLAQHKALSGITTNTGNIYRELGVLQRAEFVVPTEPDGEQKTIPYYITVAGERDFDRWLLDPATLENHSQMSTWILFAASVPREDRVEILESLRERIWLQSKGVERARSDALRTIKNNGKAHEYHPAPFLLLRELKHLTADLDFLEEFRAALEALDQASGSAV